MIKTQLTARVFISMRKSRIKLKQCWVNHICLNWTLDVCCEALFLIQIRCLSYVNSIYPVNIAKVVTATFLNV
uniref:Uncharacterized protein n=1 Tax=Anopheles funestus TaxID=62324 RepID=A0A182RMA6_ANOFN